MIISALILLAATVAPPATDEKFSIVAAEMNSPCHVRIEGKPSETPPEACATAIAAATTANERAILYFSWAYGLNESGRGLEALPNLDKAVALAPNFINARHERSYTLSDLGYYDRALVDSNRDVELTPNSAAAYSERAFARQRLADFEGTLADRLKAVELGDSSPDAAMAVVNALIWLGRYDEAAKRLDVIPAAEENKAIRADLERRRQFKPDGNEAKRCDFEQSVSDRAIAQKLVNDCTWAFDHERNPAKRADHLTVRGSMSIVALQDRNASVADLQIAVALEPRNPQRHMNYGYALMGTQHSWAARNAFDIALATPDLPKRDKAFALAGRGQARANLGDIAGAKADARASFKIEPSEANVSLLGSLAYEDGDKGAAKKFWLAAYHLGARDDSLIENLKSVGVDDPEKEPK